MLVSYFLVCPHHGYTLSNFCVVFLCTISWEFTCSSSFIYMLTWRVQTPFFEPDLEMEFVNFYLSLMLYRLRRKTLLEYKSRYAKDGHLFALF